MGGMWRLFLSWCESKFTSCLRDPTQTNETIHWLSAMKVNPLLLLVIPLLFLSGPFVNAGPVGDFFKKVGQSISKPLQPQPQPARHEPTKTPHATRRPTSRAAPTAAATPSAVAKPSQSLKEEEFTGTVRGVSAAYMEKEKAGLPYGTPISGRKDMFTST